MSRKAAAPTSAFLPTTAEEIRARGWDAPDVVLVSGDAYVDHPSFAAAILGRWLEANGYRVAILAQPDWRSAEAWRTLGRPRLFYGVSAGNMDSLVNHYTANRKRRNSDAYSPGGEAGLRPDRATAVYSQRCREAFRGVPVIAGGVEASLRRIAHYDYWSDKVWPSILATSKAHLLVYGMGEEPILEIARRLERGGDVTSLRDLRGVAYLLGKNEALPDHRWDDARCPNEDVRLPAFETVRDDKRDFAQATRKMHRETNPLNARRLLQSHGERTLVVNPPSLPLGEAQMDALYDLPYTRQLHPQYRAEVPAWQTIKESLQIMRGCFGGCAFCSITLHQGRTVQSRSERSIVSEVEKLVASPGFSGHVSDLGGPTANMYQMGCTQPEAQAMCRRPSCVHPTVCKLLETSHEPTKKLMKAARETPGVKKVHIASGIRMDLAREDPEYLEDLARHHVGGHLKVAPEHVSARVLSLMKKPTVDSFAQFAEGFESASKRAGKQQYLVPYFISSHPGSGVDDMIELAIFLKQHGYKPLQVQDFIPAPMDIATCMYWTGINPFSMKPVETARNLRDRKVQRALLQFFAPENYFVVRKALEDAGRHDLIGGGPECLISPNAPREALEGRHHSASGDERRPRETRPGYRRTSREGGRRSRKPEGS